MRSLAIGVISLIAFLILLMMGVPVFASMTICGCLGSAAIFGQLSPALTFLSSSFVETFTSYTISVAPMFMLMGEIASESGIGSKLFEAFRTIFGRLPGALASAVQVACTIFGAICGSAPATAALMSRVAYPEMKKQNYSDEIATGCIGSAASLATLIPPSLVLITFGVAAEESIGRLFMGGIFAGIVLMVLFIITIQVWCIFDPKCAPGGERTSMRDKLIAAKNGCIIEILVVFGLSMAGMFAGFFTPTEAGAVGVILMLLVTIFTRRFSWKMLTRALYNTLKLAGMLYCLMVGAKVFGKMFTLSRVADVLKTFMLGLDLPGIAVVMVIGCIFLIVGCFMETLPVVLVTLPVFLPILEAYGYSPIWYGVFNVLVAGLGAITPPVGMSAYIVSGITGAPLERTFKGSIPFIIPFMVMIFIMAIFPGVAMWLPSMVYG